MSKSELITELVALSNGQATAEELSKFSWRDLALAYESLTA